MLVLLSLLLVLLLTLLVVVGCVVVVVVVVGVVVVDGVVCGGGGAGGGSAVVGRPQREVFIQREGGMVSDGTMFLSNVSLRDEHSISNGNVNTKVDFTFEKERLCLTFSQPHEGLQSSRAAGHAKQHKNCIKPAFAIHT